MSNSIFKSMDERLKFALIGDKDALREIGYKTPKQVKKAYKKSTLIMSTKDADLVRMVLS